MRFKAILMGALSVVAASVAETPAASAQAGPQLSREDARFNARSARMNVMAAGVFYKVMSEACTEPGAFEQSLVQAEAVDERYSRIAEDEAAGTGLRDAIETQYTQQWTVDGESAIDLCNQANFTNAQTNFHNALDLYAESVAVLSPAVADE